MRIVELHMLLTIHRNAETRDTRSSSGSDRMFSLTSRRSGFTELRRAGRPEGLEWPQ